MPFDPALLPLIVLALIAFRFFRRPRRAPRTAAVLPAPFRIRNPYVIDGDTLASGPHRIRIFGIDAPESDHPQGTYATDRLRDIVSGRTLTVLPQDADKYGRLVAKLTVGTTDVGAEMVSSGYAIALKDFTREYVPLERAARRQRAGLWQDGKIADPRAWRQMSPSS